MPLSVNLSMCTVCDEEVTDKHKNALACEACSRWIHSKCGAIPVTSHNRPLLKHSNLPYVCDECMVETRLFWTNRKNRPEKRSVCTQTVVLTDPEEETVSRESQTSPEPEPVTREVQTDPLPEPLTGHEDVTLVKEDKGTQANDMKPYLRPKPAVSEARKKQAPLRIIGSSMVKKVGRHVKCTSQGSGVTSLSGAKVDRIRQEVTDTMKDLENGLLIVQGGGNGLERKGPEETVKELVEAVKTAENKKMSVAVVGILKRPRESPQYERIRKDTNTKLSEELMKMKVEWLSEKKGNISFINMDPLLKNADFCEDGVHLNDGGNERLARRLIQWVHARSLQCVGPARG